MSTKIKTISALALLMAGMAATPAMAEAGDTFIRVRGIMVAPNEDSTGITPAFPAETVSVDNAIAPEVDITHLVIPLLFGSIGTAFGYAPVWMANSVLLSIGGWLVRRSRH